MKNIFLNGKKSFLFCKRENLKFQIYERKIFSFGKYYLFLFIWLTRYHSNAANRMINFLFRFTLFFFCYFIICFHFLREKWKFVCSWSCFVFLLSFSSFFAPNLHSNIHNFPRNSSFWKFKFYEYLSWIELVINFDDWIKMEFRGEFVW